MVYVEYILYDWITGKKRDNILYNTVIYGQKKIEERDIQETIQRMVNSELDDQEDDQYKHDVIIKKIKEVRSAINVEAMVYTIY